MSILGKQAVKNTNTWRLKNTFIDNKQFNEEIEKERKKIPRYKWQWIPDDPKPMGNSKSSSKREVYSNMILPQETRKTSNRQPNFTGKTTAKRITKKLQS